MRTTILIAATALGLGASALGTGAVIAQQGPAPRIGQACRADIAAHCANVEKGKGGRVECLRQNEAKLTPACAAAVKAAVEVREAVRTACRDDRARLCGKGARGEGIGATACLRSKQAELSKACADALANLPPPKGDK